MEQSWWLWALVAVTFIIIIALVLWFTLGNKKSVPPSTAQAQPPVKSRLTYFRFLDDLSNNNSIELIETIKQVLDAAGATAGGRTTADIYFFETLNIIDHLMGKAPFGTNTKFIFGIQGTDDMVSKSMMALNMRKTLSVEVAARILPITFIYDLQSDLRILYNDIRKESGVYILKKNIQRQEGNLITRDPQTIMDAGKKDYVVAQRLLTNPLIVGGRKVNMRVYLLVYIPPGGERARFAIYNNGFMYYTPKQWDPLSIDPDVHITTGYIDREVYERNPLTYRDLEVYMGAPAYARLWDNIKAVMSNVRETFQDHLTQQNKAYPGTKFLIYGCDVQPDDQFGVKLIEINKGPDLGYKDERDKEVKYNMVSDAFRLVGATGDAKQAGGFVEV